MSRSIQGGVRRAVHRKDADHEADLLNDRVVPFFDEQGIPLCRMLTDRGTGYCGNPGASRVPARLGAGGRRAHSDEGEAPANERHLRALSPLGARRIVPVALRKKLYPRVQELQDALDAQLVQYNEAAAPSRALASKEVRPKLFKRRR